MQCYQIHQDESGCGQEIPAGGWSYCPACGRSTGHLNRFEAADGRFHVPKNRAAVCHLTLHNRGYSAVRVALDLDEPRYGLCLAAKQARDLQLNPNMPARVDLEIPAMDAESVFLGALIVHAYDASLDSEEAVWHERRPREFRLSLFADVSAPAEIRVLEEAALFRPDLGERQITLQNFGSVPGDVLSIEAPPGYTLKEPPETMRIAAGERKTITVRREGRPAACSDLKIRMESGAPTVELHNALDTMWHALPFAVIGIDFGTTFSSVAFRQCRYSPDLPDAVEFLRPPTEQTGRFPTVVWIGQNKEIAFGTEANERYHQDPGAGYRYREIKTLLRRSGGSAKIDPAEFREAGSRFAQREFGEEWGEHLVMRYLQWLLQTCIAPELQIRFGSSDTAVQFVFSVPVLDFGRSEGDPQYRAQTTAMLRCIHQAGFCGSEDYDDRVELAFEPSCAALGLLHPPEGVARDTTATGDRTNSWPVLGSYGYPAREGDTIAVFDSGGGTTDVVLASVTQKASVTGPLLDLHVDRCLGVGTESETFGGEWVTEQVQQALNAPETVKDQNDKPAMNWAKPALDFRGLRIKFEDPLDSKVRREAAEEIKFALADGKSYSIPGFQQTTDPPVVVPPTEILAILLPLLISRPLKSLGDELDLRVFDAQARHATKYYLFVGGNTRLPFLRRWAQHLMGDPNADFGKRRLQLPEEFRQLAVAYGAAWMPDARVRDAIPYDLTVMVGDREFLRLSRNQSSNIPVKSEPLRLPPRGTLDLRLQAVLDGQPRCVGANRFGNPYDKPQIATLQASVKDNRLAIRCVVGDSPAGPGADWKLLLEYPL
jgi:hypothetical protein